MQTGGKFYGQGVHGRVIDIAAAPDDPDTFSAFLDDEKDSGPVLMYVLKGGGQGYSVVQVEPQSPLWNALQKAVTDAEGSMIAKVFVGSGMALVPLEDAFMAEIETSRRIHNALGKRSVARLTTVEGLKVGGKLVQGVKVGKTFVTFNRRCDSDLDAHEMKSYREVASMIHQILECFSYIHRAEILHADVKRGNIMSCRDSFKLIDWGASATFDEIRDLYAATRTPRNCASPMAWYAWGLADQSASARKLLHKIVHAKIVRRQTLFVRPEFQKFVESAFQSFEKKLESLHKRGKGVDANVRRAVIRDFVPSFDLYNFGIVVASYAMSPDLTLTQKQARTLMGFAKRLTHYSHAEFVGNDATLARKLWAVMAG